MKKVKISKYILSLIATTTISCCSLSFGMNIFDAIKENNIMQVGEILKDKSFNINKADNNGRTPLYWACKNDDLNIVTLLLESGAKESINKADEFGWTPLCNACSSNNLDIVTFLLDYACRELDESSAQESINKVDNDGRTPLYWACVNSNEDVVELLLKKGAEKSINIDSNDGMTPLFWACRNDDLNIVTLLLESGAKESINKADEFGWTPLFWACSNNNLNIVTLLLANGANIDQKSLNKAADKPIILRLLTSIQDYDKVEDKIKFIIKQNVIWCFILIKRALVQSLNEIQKNGRSIDGTVFGKLYDRLKDNKKFKIVLNVPRNCDNIYEFIKHAAKNNQKGFIEKNIMALKSKAALGKQKFTDVTIKFAEGDKENMEDEEDNQNIVPLSILPPMNELQESNKRKREDIEEENTIEKRRKFD